MTDPLAPPKQPASSERALADRLARAEREAAALRANLRKRKDQARARDLPPTPSERPEP